MNKSTETKVIIIYNYNHIICAMKAASKLEKKIIIESPPNAASYMGPLFFKKLLKKGKSLFPTIKYIEILDCGNDTGLALETIHHEINLKIKCNKIVLEKIKIICKKRGLSVNDTNKKKLDLKHVEDVYDECLKWLNN